MLTGSPVSSKSRYASIIKPKGMKKAARRARKNAASNRRPAGGQVSDVRIAAHNARPLATRGNRVR